MPVASPAAGPGLIAVPERASTAGDTLLALAPMGADVVVELDLARLRDNPIVGPLLQRLASAPVAAGDWLEPTGEPPDHAVTWLEWADSVLLAAYHVGEDRAVAITLIRSSPHASPGRAPDPGMGTRIDERTHVLGPPSWVEQVLRVRQREQPPLTQDRQLMAVRALAMPERASGAFLRMASRLDFDARVALAARFDLDHVPETVSLWADVADDLAVVATVSGSEDHDGNALARALLEFREQVAAMPWVRARYLHFTLHSIDIAATGKRARVVLIVGPRRLRRMVGRLGRAIQSFQPSISP